MASERIILISANTHREPYPVYPLGLSYLKTYLCRTLPDTEVVLLDCNLDSDAQIVRTLREREPLFVGISLRNADGANSLEQHDFVARYAALTRLVKKSCTAPVVLGGAAFSMFPAEFMRALEADYGLTGEGEESMRQLAVALSEGTAVEHIEGLASLRGETVRINPRTEYLRTLEVEFDDRLVDYYWKYSGMLNIQTKRGCPYDCVYCSYPVIDGRRVRTLEPGEIVESIARQHRDNGVGYFFFTDSVFNIGDSYNVQFAEELVRSGTNISWGAYFSPKNIDREMMSLFKASGLTHVEFGTESISDECLEKYRKRFTADDVFRASEICLDLNIYYAHFLIFGGYGETPGTLEETIENSKRIRHSVFFPYVGMRIYPRTGLQRIAVEQGLIDASDMLFEQKYYVAPGFDLEHARRLTAATGKSWVFPDDPHNGLMDEMRIKRGKKGLLWEYLRKP